MMATNDHTPNPRPTPKPSSSDNAARPHIRRVKLAAAVVALGAIALPHAASAQLERPGRTAPAGCMAVTVQRGDTVSAIARANSLTLDQIAGLNPHISNLNRVWPGDQVAVTCQPDGVALAVPQAVTRDVDVSRWLDEREADGKLTWRAVVAHLYAAGFRGDDLVTMAAIVPGESGRRIDAVGDVDIQTGTWGPSVGFAQVRTLKAATGTGAPRDIAALTGNPAHQAWAAHEIYVAAGRSFRPWTAWLKGWHHGHLDTVRSTVAEMGL